MRYKVLWDNGHACDAFSETFNTEEEAETFGNNWRNEMISLDEKPKEAAEAYQFEVVEVLQ